ncbi:MAG TPA: hopanoid-associated sugar epimerase [Nevskiaceae bacterium]
MRVLVTGATGFVGSAVVRRALAAGTQVRALARDGSDRENLAGLDVEVSIGDLRDQASLERACAGCEAVFHVAADYRLWVPHPDEIYEANVGGTRRLLKAARAARVRRVVYTSSVATLGIPGKGQPGDEDTPVTLDAMIGHYKRSKYLAEEEAQRFVTDGLDVVIVNPSTPIGPRDIKPTPTGRVIRDAAAGKMPAYVDTGLNIVHVDDVANGHWLALERGKPGRRYVLGGTDMTLREILTAIAGLTGHRAPRVRLPHALVLPIAFVAERIARITGGQPLATVAEVRMSTKYMFFSSARAKAELGYEARPAIEALRDAVAWFQARSLPA